MMQYDGDLKLPARFLVPPPAIHGTSGQILAKNGITTFACSETQKFGHVRPSHVVSDFMQSLIVLIMIDLLTVVSLQKAHIIQNHVQRTVVVVRNLVCLSPPQLARIAERGQVSDEKRHL